MNAKQLKNSVLQFAMRGKLVEQVASEGSAESFYNDILKHKEMLSQDKKAQSNSITEFRDKEQFQWEIPQNWKWTTFGKITINRDSERIPLSKSSRENQKNKKYDYYGASGVIDKVEDYLFDKTLLLIGEDGANLLARSTPIAFLAKGKYWVNNHAHVIDGIHEVFLEYISFYINSISLADFVTGTAQPKMNQKNLNSIPVPLPPFEEQKRIIKKIKEVFSIIEKYGEKYLELEVVLNKFPKELEKSILQYAMQGKLVEQDSNDKPVQQLIEKIQLEKERLIKEKFIKKEKPLLPITEEEIPFDIPSSWEWVRLGSIINLISGRDLTSSEYGTNNKETPYITGASNFNNGTVEVTRWTPCPKVISKKGDILITCKGTVGELAIQNLKEAHIARQVMAIRLIHTLDKEFIQLCLKYKVTELKHAAKSMIPGISRADLLNLVIPLPPYEEQIRIVQAVENLSIVTNNLRNNN